MSSIKFTKAGWLYIVLTILMGFSAINTNNNLVFITVSLMLAVMGISGFFGKSNLDGLVFSVFSRDEIYAGRKTELIVNIKNNKKIAFSALIKFNILDQSGKILFLKPSDSLSVKLMFNFDERGVKRIGRITVSSVYPFNFFVRSKVYNLDVTLIVFPQLIDISSFNFLQSYKSLEISEKVSTGLGQEELSNIRKYFNDPLNKIFWKHFAKSEKLYTKEFAGETEITFYVVFEDILKSSDVEMAVKIAASIIFMANRERKPLIFVMEEKRYNILDIYDKRESLKKLALYGKNN